MGAINIRGNATYMCLDSWVLANIIQLATFDFCRKFLNRTNDPAGRMFDQMTQAARSGQANIAEGSARRQTSCETELKLLDVARASLNELAGDYMFILMSRGEGAWSKHDERYQAVAFFTLEKAAYGEDYMRDVMLHIMRQRQRLAAWLDGDDVSIVANTILILTWRVVKLLEKQIQYNLERFKSDGGFTENLTKERLASIKAESQNAGAPACPQCGAPMVERVIRRGLKQGQRFWGCSDYPRCNGTKKITP